MTAECSNKGIAFCDYSRQISKRLTMGTEISLDTNTNNAVVGAFLYSVWTISTVLLGGGGKGGDITPGAHLRLCCVGRV